MYFWWLFSLQLGLAACRCVWYSLHTPVSDIFSVFVFCILIFCRFQKFLQVSLTIFRDAPETDHVMTISSLSSGSLVIAGRTAQETQLWVGGVVLKSDDKNN